LLQENTAGAKLYNQVDTFGTCKIESSTGKTWNSLENFLELLGLFLL